MNLKNAFFSKFQWLSHCATFQVKSSNLWENVANSNIFIVRKNIISIYNHFNVLFNFQQKQWFIRHFPKKLDQKLKKIDFLIFFPFSRPKQVYHEQDMSYDQKMDFSWHIKIFSNLEILTKKLITFELKKIMMSSLWHFKAKNRSFNIFKLEVHIFSSSKVII